MNSTSISDQEDSPYHLLLLSLSLIPIPHYLFAFAAFIVVSLYNFLELHLLQDFLGGFRGQPVDLTFNPDSKIYDAVASKCGILRGRYLVTPWLASTHLQTAFVNFFGRPPNFGYRRKIFQTADGGTIALDWLLKSDVLRGSANTNNDIAKDDQTPIVIVVPGLSSDSESPYLKHLAYNTAKSGWNVVVINHRGLGGVSITSDIFYNAGWTVDVRAIVHHLHNEYSCAPLYLIGTSVGANVVVKYLGEEGDNIPIAGAVAVCSPWDVLIVDRYIGRTFKQNFYDLAVASGLKGYAKLHQLHFSRFCNLKGIEKARRLRDFDKHCTIIVGKYETVDTYYRRCSSVNYLGNVCVPLLCISALDDPICTREAIPWDECRLNKNIILATTKHGGHLGFFEGITGSSLWWVRATNEFLHMLHQSPYTHTQTKMKISPSPEPITDQIPLINMAEDGNSADMTNQPTTNTDKSVDPKASLENEEEPAAKCTSTDDSTAKKGEVPSSSSSNFLKRHLNQLSRHSKGSMWLLIYVSVVSSWPLVGTALYFLFRKKVKGIHPSAVRRRQ